MEYSSVLGVLGNIAQILVNLDYELHQSPNNPIIKKHAKDSAYNVLEIAVDLAVDSGLSLNEVIEFIQENWEEE